MTLRQQHDFLMRLLFDADLRARFSGDREATLAEEGLTGADAEPFERVDRFGLELDAAMRRRYLMSALCRPFPIASTALGAFEGGAARLAQFLSGVSLTRTLAERTRAFGSFLGGVLEANEAQASEQVIALVRAFLELERERAAAAASLRAAVEAGSPPPAPPAAYSNNALKRGRIVVPEHFVAAELPVPSSIMMTALDHPTPETAWALIDAGSLTPERLESVARGMEIAVTVLNRAVLVGRGVERAGAGGVSPLVEVAHRTVELSGRRGDLIALWSGQRLADLSPSIATLTRNLLEAGLLDLRE